MQEGDIAFFCSKPAAVGLVLRAKMCQHRPQIFKKFNNAQAFPYENDSFSLSSFFFLNEPIAGTPRHVCKSFEQKCEDLTAMRRASNSYLTPKVDSILELSNYYVTAQITHVFRTNVQMFVPFFGDRS